METLNASISFNPTDSQLNEIEQWLIDENNKKREGFYCNWNTIKSANSKNRMAVISVENRVVGFVIWNDSQHTASIDIAEIKPSHRKKGYGKMLINCLFDFFVAKDILVAELLCKPASSEKVWKKLGFVEFPKVNAFARYNTLGNKQLYKILVPYAEQKTSVLKSECIELWDDEPYKATNKKPIWIWDAAFRGNTKTLINPIIFPCHRDWRIMWRKGDEILKDDKVKYFDTDIDWGNFMIIRELPTPNSK